MSAPTHIVFFDGTCGFCQASVQWLLDRDRRGVLHYAPLQGQTAAEARRRHPDFPEDLDTAVLLRRDAGGSERIWLRSSAVLRTCALLGWPWRALAALLIAPAPLRDPLYRAFAARRHQLLGTAAACRIPDPDQAARLLP